MWFFFLEIELKAMITPGSESAVEDDETFVVDVKLETWRARFSSEGQVTVIVGSIRETLSEPA